MRVMLGSGGSHVCFPRRDGEPDALHSLTHAQQVALGIEAIGLHSVGLTAQFAILDVQFAKCFSHAAPLRRCMFDHVAKRCCRVQGGKHGRAGAFYIVFQAFDLLLRSRVSFMCVGEGRGSLVSSALNLRSAAPVLCRGTMRRLAPPVEIADLFREFSLPGCERVNLLAIEFCLLLSAIDVELPGVGVFADLDRAVLSLGLFNAQAGYIGLALSNARTRSGFPLTRFHQPRLR